MEREEKNVERRQKGYPDMVLVVTLDDFVPVEVIVGAEVTPLVSRPLDILRFTPKALEVVDQTQYQIDPILLGLRNHVIQTLQRCEGSM